MTVSQWLGSHTAFLLYGVIITICAIGVADWVEAKLRNNRERPPIDISTVERFVEDVEEAVLDMFPNAELCSDDLGYLIVETHCLFTGYDGDILIGTMNVPGDDPR